MKVLITGAGGFIGSALAGALSSLGARVLAFDTRFHEAIHEVARRDSSLRMIQGDMTDAASVHGVFYRESPDAVIHAAAVVGVLASTSPAQMINVNVLGTINLLEAMSLYGVRRAIHISSEEVLGDFCGDAADERHPMNPEMPYGITKAAVEHLGRSYVAMRGLEFLNVRTSWAYGPGLPRDRIPKTLVEAGVNGTPLHIPYGAESRIDHTYIDDLVDGVLRVLDRADHPYDTYNIASGTAPTLAEVVETVREVIPSAEISIGPGEYRHSEEIRMVRKGALDISRARRILGYEPRFDIAAGLRSYIQSYDRN